MPNRQEAKCKVCGITFQYYIGSSNGVYCSRKCYRQDKAIQFKNCVICGTKYIPDKGSPKNWTKSKYCSLKCAEQGKFKGELLKCEFCGAETWAKPYRIKRVQHIFCSHSCNTLYHKEYSLLAGELNPNYRGGPRKVICPTCKKEFGTYSKTKKFCSYKCVKSINTTLKGAQKERYVVHLLKDLGYQATRTPSSHGIWDVWAVNEKELLLIQVKACKKIKKKHIKGMFKKDFARMREVKLPPSARQEFWVFPNGKELIRFEFDNETQEFKEILESIN